MLSHLLGILPFFGVRLPSFQEFLFDSLLVLKLLLATEKGKRGQAPFFVNN
jgi:hypothetical protein